MIESLTLGVSDTGRALRFPDECPCCGIPATTPVRVTKIFARRTRKGIVWIHHHVDVRACRDCAHDYMAQARPSDVHLRTALRRQTLHVLPTTVAGALVIGCGLLVTGAGVTATARHASAFQSATVAALGLGIAGTGLGLIVGGWLARRAAVVPGAWPDAQYAVEVPVSFGGRAIVATAVTPLSRSVDFSDDRRDDDEPSWRTFSFARQSYARDFSRLNARRLFDCARPGSDASPSIARSPALQLRALWYAAGAILAVAVVWSVLG